MADRAHVEDLVEAVLTVVEGIPPGRVMAYGEVAAVVTDTVGPIGPRRVGAIMREYGGAVPWYRVLHADGSVAAQVADEQAELLAAEGVPMRRGRVPDEYRHRP